MFFLLRKVIIGVTLLAAVAAGFWLRQQPQITEPVMDFVEIGRERVEIWRNREADAGKIIGQMSGPVVRIYDGNTFQLRDAAGPFNCRLLGVTVPQMPADRMRALASSNCLASLILSNHVTLQVTHMNANRTGMGLVWRGSNLVNVAMIQAGQGRITPRLMSLLPTETRFALVNAEKQAQERKAGLWQTAGP